MNLFGQYCLTSNLILINKNNTYSLYRTGKKNRQKKSNKTMLLKKEKHGLHKITKLIALR